MHGDQEILTGARIHHSPTANAMPQREPVAHEVDVPGVVRLFGFRAGRAGHRQPLPGASWYGQSFEAQIDDDGRLTIPQKYRDRIGLKSEAFFISAGDYFRIWNPETYESKAARLSARLASQFDEDFDPRSLLPPLPPKG